MTRGYLTYYSDFVISSPGPLTCQPGAPALCCCASPGRMGEFQGSHILSKSRLIKKGHIAYLIWGNFQCLCIAAAAFFVHYCVKHLCLCSLRVPNLFFPNLILCDYRILLACRNEYCKMCPECYNQKVALSTTAVKKWK